jgi:malate dehydrogenase (oxaloacetate-decarboxylating)
MLVYKITRHLKTGEKILETSLTGKALLTIAQLNKGTAFSDRERREFGLLGKLPVQIETLEQQVQRAYSQFLSYQTDLQKNIYLNELHDNNQVLFYALLNQHISEMLPLIYTPIVGNAVKSYSDEFRQSHGLFINYPERDEIRKILANRSNPEVDVIVVTDGEGVLGIGDQGVGAIDISIAKLMVYTLFGGIDPRKTLPIVLDVGTNNETLLNNPFYLGWRHSRIQDKAYLDFIDQFVSSIKEIFPGVFLHFEDFGNLNARIILRKYRQQLCCFNDDIQGTGVVAFAALQTACHVAGLAFTAQRFIIFGAGNAGLGITEQIYQGLIQQGLSAEEARSRFYLINSTGLITFDYKHLNEAQKPFARSKEDIKDFILTGTPQGDLIEVIKKIKPQVLIGCSGQPGMFNYEIVHEMARHVERPIIFPLSNPTSLCEAYPEDLIRWTQGRALIATGSPFNDVVYRNKVYKIAQCNNAFVFPGIGLGVIAVKAKILTSQMLWAAALALIEKSIANVNNSGQLLPEINSAIEVAQYIGLKVAIAALKEEVAERIFPIDDLTDLKNHIQNIYWHPEYLPYFLKK